MTERKAPTGTITGKPAMRIDWRTPPHLLEAVRAYFGGQIPCDAATHHSNPTGALRYFALGEREDGSEGPHHLGSGGGEWLGRNGLVPDWVSDKVGGQVFCNPPYGKAIRLWLAKMAQAADRGAEVVALLPAARWEQSYLTDTLCRANAVCFIRKRVKFINPSTGDAVGGNPYANYFLGFNVETWRWRDAFGPHGRCFELEAL